MSIPRALFKRSATSRLSNIHNGKGRPDILCKALSSGSLSTTTWNPRRVSQAGRAIALPATYRSLSTSQNTSGASTLDQSSQVTATPAGSAVNAWESNYDFAADATQKALVEPHIGYLKELGLDFGWGPSSIMEFVIEHVHVWGGMPWFGTLLLTAIGLRLALVPLFVRSADMSGRMSSIAHLVKPLATKMAQARTAGDQQAMMQAVRESREIEKRAGVKKTQIFLPMLVQIPLAFGSFRVTRNMTYYPELDLENGGFLWFTDLTLRDPYFVLPAAASVMLYFTMRKGGEVSGTEQQVKLMKSLAKFFPLLSFACTAMLPAALTVQFGGAAVMAFMQTSLINNDSVRDAIGIHKIVKPAPPVQPYRGTITPVVETTVNAPPAKELGYLDQLRKKGEDAKQSALKMKKQAEETMTGGKAANSRLSKMEKSKAAAYEKRRREELEEELYQRRQALLKKQRGEERE